MKRRNKLILTGSAFLLGVFGGTIFGILASVGGVIALPLFFGKKIEPRWVVAVLIAFLLGVFRGEMAPRSNPNFENDFGKTREIHGVLRDFPDRRRDFENWILTTDRGKILLKVSRRNDLDLGDKLRVRGIFEKPFETEEFSYSDFLARAGIFGVMSFPKTEKTGEKEFLPILTPIWNLRLAFEKKLSERIFGEEGAFAAGILVGERSGFSEETEENFRRVGLTHLLALSGFNITIVALAVLAVLFWLPQKVRIGTTIGAITLFVLFVGGGASVVRAAVMGGIGLLAVHSGRTRIAFLSLIYASVAMVSISPLILAFDPSFQLSIAGTAGILAFGEIFKKWLLRILPLFFAEALATTMAAQIAVAPLIGLLFGQISLIAPLANLVIAPPIPLAMLFGFLTTISGDFFGNIFAFVTWNLLHFGLLGVEFFAQWEWASINFSLSKMVFWILSVGITAAGIGVQRRSSQK